MRVGIGYDVHALVSGRPLVLGGVTVPHKFGLEGHSDADVLIHAIMDALLGAAGLGDIGKHFPDNDAQYKNISSLKLLAQVKEKLGTVGYEIDNIDSVIIAQTPKLSPYIKIMVENIARVLAVEENEINVKATTTEKLGFPGRQEGIAAQAIALLK